MKTTIDLDDDLFLRLKAQARRSGQPMRDLVAEGLRRVLDADEPAPWRLPDRAVGECGARNPLEALSWPDLRDEIYGGR